MNATMSTVVLGKRQCVVCWSHCCANAATAFCAHLFCRSFPVTEQAAKDISYKELKGWRETSSSYVQIKEEAKAADEAEALEATGSNHSPGCLRRLSGMWMYCAPLVAQHLRQMTGITRRLRAVCSDSTNAWLSFCRLQDFKVHDKQGTQQPLDGVDLQTTLLFLTGAAKYVEMYFRSLTCLAGQTIWPHNMRMQYLWQGTPYSPVQLPQGLFTLPMERLQRKRATGCRRLAPSLPGPSTSRRTGRRYLRASTAVLLMEV